MSAVGLMKLIERLTYIPKWSFIWLPFSLLGVFLIDTHILYDLQGLVLLPSMLLSAVFAMMIWVKTKSNRAVKMIFVLCMLLVNTLSIMTASLALSAIAIKWGGSREPVSHCLEIVGRGDYKPNRKFIGEYVLVSFEGYIEELVIPPEAAAQGKVPQKCLTATLSKGLFDIHFLEEIHWGE